MGEDLDEDLEEDLDESKDALLNSDELLVFLGEDLGEDLDEDKDALLNSGELLGFLDEDLGEDLDEDLGEDLDEDLEEDKLRNLTELIELLGFLGVDLKLSLIGEAFNNISIFSNIFSCAINLVFSEIFFVFLILIFIYFK